MVLAWPSIGGSEDQGTKLPGSGGALFSWIVTKIHPTIRLRTGRCQDSEENSRRYRQVHRGVELNQTVKPPRGLQGPGCRMKVAKGVAHRHRKRRQPQENGVGRRDERSSLAGGSCRQHPGRRGFALVEEVDIG